MTAFQSISGPIAEPAARYSSPLDSLKGIGTPDCDRWRTKIFARHPWFSAALAAEYRRIAKTENSHVPANRWLSTFEKQLKLGRTGLFVDCQDSEITSYAAVKATRMHGLIAQYAQAYGRASFGLAARRAAEEVEKAGLAFPLDLSKPFGKDEAISAMTRVCKEDWWRRGLRAIAARSLEQICRNLGMVSCKRAPYVSDFTLSRRALQKYRNRETLMAMEAENQEGFKATLAEMSDASVSNPVNRRNELMVRMRGFEECATAIGFDGLFLTLTCPSRFHAVLHNGKPNPKYAGATPAEAQAYLCDTWAKIRAKWHRIGIRTFGFRIAEPHHDGTPHWHLMLFFAPDQTDAAATVFRAYALASDPHEPGAQKYRCEIVKIDPSKGTAAGYIAKYVSKNIDGYGMGSELDEETGHFVIETAQRVEAWGSTWGIRQFQQIGSASVTVWRELRRIRGELDSATPEELEQIRAACDAGDWARFVDLMGGPLVERKALPVRALHLSPGDFGPVHPSENETKYGELSTRIMGVILRGAHRHITRIHQWRIQRVEPDQNLNLGRLPGAPWTCVNNCTPGDTRSRQ